MKKIGRFWWFLMLKIDFKSRRACGHVDVGTCPHQVLAATLTLSQPGWADYAHPILVSTPSFESHRRAWNMGILILLKFLVSLLPTFSPSWNGHSGAHPSFHCITSCIFLQNTYNFTLLKLDKLKKNLLCCSCT